MWKTIICVELNSVLVGQAYGCDTDFIISYIVFPAIQILELLILVQAAPLIGLDQLLWFQNTPLGGSFEVKYPLGGSFMFNSTDLENRVVDIGRDAKSTNLEITGLLILNCGVKGL